MNNADVTDHGRPPLEGDVRREDFEVISLLRRALGTADTPPGSPEPTEVAAERLVAAIRRHRLGGVLQAWLPAADKALLPDLVAQWLPRAAESNQLRSLRQSAELIQIGQWLDLAGVPFRALKGPVLAEELYGGSGIRFAGDVDLLIRTGDADAVDQLLRAEGFRRLQPQHPVTPRQWDAYRAVWRDAEYISPTGMRVEIMWRLANLPVLDERAWCGEPVAVRLGNRVVCAPELPSHAMYLLVHGAMHGWFRLFWLVDIALVMRRPNIDWIEWRALAAAAGMERPFWQGLTLARDLLGATWPTSLPAPPDTVAQRRLLAGARRHLASSPAELNVGKAHIWMTFYNRRLGFDRQWHRRETRKHWINPAHWALVRLPDRWFGLYTWFWPILWILRQLRTRMETR